MRAARLRVMQPALYLIGAVTIIVGFYMAMVVPKSEVAAGSSSVQQQAEKIRQPVDDTLAAIPGLSLKNEDYAQLANAEELPTVSKLILDKLNKSGKLPDLPLKKVSVQDFWTKAWPLTELPTVGNDEVRLVGAVAEGNNHKGYYVEPVRWLGVYAKRNGKWELLSASDTPFTPMTDQKASLRDIPITLKPLLLEAKQ